MSRANFGKLTKSAPASRRKKNASQKGKKFKSRKQEYKYSRKRR